MFEQDDEFGAHRGGGVARGSFPRGGWSPGRGLGRRPGLGLGRGQAGSGSWSSSQSSSGWGAPMMVSSGSGGGVDPDAIADQIANELFATQVPIGPVSYGADTEPDPEPEYGFSCEVPPRRERMGALDVERDVTRPSRVPPEFLATTPPRSRYGAVPAPMVPAHYGTVPAPMVPAHYGAVPAPMVPSHYGATPSPMVPSHLDRYGEDSRRPGTFEESLKIGLGVGLGLTAVMVGVNLVARAMR